MENERLINELLQYGTFCADFECDIADGAHRVTVIRHDVTNKVYWLHRHNGNVIEFKEV
jgi:hypothetical protein